MIQEKLQEYFTKEEQEELKRLLNKFCDCLDEQTEILKKKERKNQMLKLFRYLKKSICTCHCDRVIADPTGEL